MEGNTSEIPSMDIFPPEGLVSGEAFEIFEYVVDLCIGSVLCYLGIVNNILTLVVFSKIGFKETANISMSAIAIWDLVKCVCVAMIRLHWPVQLASEALGISWKSVTIVTFGYLYSTSAYNVSTSLTTYVAIERCLCISMPFTVKSLLTRRTVTVTCVSISILVTATFIVIFTLFEFVEIIDERTNMSVIIFQDNAWSLSFPGIRVYLFGMSVVYPVVTFLISCVCTVIIVHHLKKATKFRSGIKGDNQADESSQLSSRDRQVIKMLVVIIVINIVCFLPMVAQYTALTAVPGFDAGKRYNNLFWVCMEITLVSDMINSSVNIFIFYSMSSQFKSTMRQLFNLQSGKHKTKSLQ